MLTGPGLISTQLPELPPIAPAPVPTAAPEAGEADFASFLKNVVTDANASQLQADAAVRQLVSGQGGDIHQVMLSMEQARMSMLMLAETRNKVVEAYQEISKMPM